MEKTNIYIYNNIELEDDPNWLLADYTDLCFYLREVAMCYEELGFNYQTKPILVQYREEGPMCSNSETGRDIFLSAQSSYWCQYMYQFAHELCHHFIDGPLDGSHISSFWFEESVCEMASEYFMTKLSHKWLTHCEEYTHLGDFPLKTLNYAINIRKADTNINTPLSEWIRENIKDLSTTQNEEIGKYERKLYKVIAHGILPIFEDNPDLWIILPYLKRLPNEQYQNFDYWLTKIVEPQIQENLKPAYLELKSVLLG